MDVLSTENSFRDDLPDHARRPQGLWARVDHVDLRDDRIVAILDAVDASWFEASATGKRGWFLAGDAEFGEQVSVVELPVVERLRINQWLHLVLAEVPNDGGFARLNINEQQGHRARQFDTLFAAGIERRVTSLRPATRREAARLGAAGSMDSLADADTAEIEDRLRASLGSSPPDTAAVFDVGQGSWNALLRDGEARLLFDVGGGVLQNARTFPQAFARFCFARHPLVILSHWDWDHWSSACRFPEAQSLTWVIPRQGSLGPTHARFLASLRANGPVVVFPRASPAIRVSGLELQQATGPRRNRNESGLTLLAERDGANVLFPGDAGYGHLTLPKRLTSIVVPHHGGVSRASVTNLPASDRATVGRVVYSYGSGNSYGHPKPETEQLHRGWAQALRTANRRRDRQNREIPGHVELYWSEPITPSAGCTCGETPFPLPQR